MVLSKEKDKKYTLFIALIILFSSFSIIVLNYFSIKILSSIRAYVNGESQYSKAQKDASSYLTNYINSPDDYYYHLFTKELQVPIGDRIAREAVQYKLGYDKVRKGFLQGRNHKDDIENLNWLFVNFQTLPYLKMQYQNGQQLTLI
ncbi:MAG: integral rane sensor signal transduction histidine kinase [Sphingobacteriales bacterium]|nr:integral rane sensor signal transduction histidine kinase [Sphingobacteriales bacterium]